MNKTEEIKYAELIISMSTDFLLKKISLELYTDNMDMINSALQKMHYEDNQRRADEALNEDDI